jgi:hypothetical protein
MIGEDIQYDEIGDSGHRNLVLDVVTPQIFRQKLSHLLSLVPVGNISNDNSQLSFSSRKKIPCLTTYKQVEEPR